MSEETEKTGKEALPRGANLDLGLSSLLDGCEATPEVGPLNQILKNSVENSKPAPLTEPLANQKPASPEVPSSPYSSLARSEKWSELAKVCEAKLAATSDGDKEAKLWWIKSQRATKAIPASILAPSLDPLARTILADGYSGPAENKDLCRELVSDFSRDLKQSDPELSACFAAYLGTPILEKRTAFDITPKPPEASIPPPRKVEGLNFNFRYIFYAAALLFFFFLAFNFRAGIGRTYKRFFALFSPAAEEVSPSLRMARVAGDPEFKLPESERVAGLNNLDAVFYDISEPAGQSETAPKVDSAPAPEPVKVSVPVKSPPVASLPNRSAEELEQAGSSRGKDSINTKYPVERELPRAERDRSGQDEIYEIDFPPFRRGGPQQSQSPAGGKGDPNFVVIARTRVMVEPSYWSKSASDLYEGDRILVEAELGKWLRIKAKNGDIGYILAQDANRIY